MAGLFDYIPIEVVDIGVVAVVVVVIVVVGAR